MGIFFTPPQLGTVRNDFVGRPKDVFNTNDIMSLGYFDVSEHVSNIISILERLPDALRAPRHSFYLLKWPKIRYFSHFAKMAKITYFQPF